MLVWIQYSQLVKIQVDPLQRRGLSNKIQVKLSGKKTKNKVYK